MCFLVYEPTIREVFCADFRDRIVQHFVYNELNPVIEKVLIKDTCSCRLGKGTDYAIRRLGRFVRRETKNYTAQAYYLKLDLSGFFMSINRQKLLDMVMELIRHKYRGQYKEVLEYLVPIIILSDVTSHAQRICSPEEWKKLPARKTLFGNSNGMPIGNICSQLFANLYLSPLDHLVKCSLGCSSYVRYVDDMAIIERSRSKLDDVLNRIEKFLPQYNMRINRKKTYIKDIKYGVSFLGIDVKPFYSIMSRRRINKLYKDGRTFLSAEEAYVRTSCRRGNFMRYHGRNIAMRWYGTLPENIKSDFKIQTDMKCHYLISDRRTV